MSHNVLYHQPLSITRPQERFYANNYFELLPIVSTAFKGQNGSCIQFNHILNHLTPEGAIKLNTNNYSPHSLCYTNEYSCIRYQVTCMYNVILYR